MVYVVASTTLEDYCSTAEVESCLRNQWTLQTAGPIPNLDPRCEAPKTIGTVVTFDKDGNVTENFDQSMGVTCRFATDTTTTRFSGTGTAHVAAHHGYMHVSGSDASGVSVHSIYNGIPIDLGTPAVFISGVGITDGDVLYKCNTHELDITVPSGIQYHYTR